MAGNTSRLALFCRRFCLPNGWRKFPRQSKPFRCCLSTKRPSVRETLPESHTNSTSSQTRQSFSITKFFGWYTRQQRSRPYITELCSMSLIYFVGDFAAQIVGGDSYDSRRTLRSIAIGVVVAIPSLRWFNFLGRHFNYPSSIVSTCTKVAVNQLIYTSMFNVYFFAFHAILSGMTISGVIQRVKSTVSKSLPRSFLYWPFVMAINFTYVQPQSRSIVTAIFAVFWQSYLSWLNAQAQKHENGHGSSFTLPE